LRFSYSVGDKAFQNPQRFVSPPITSFEV
jgi:hypothetical protein